MKLLAFDPEKAALRAALKAFHAAVRSAPQICADLAASTDEFARSLHDDLHATSAKVENQWHARVPFEFGEAAIWVATRDTAYMDLFKDLLAKFAERVLGDPGTWRGLLSVVDSRLWTVNQEVRARRDPHAASAVPFRDDLEAKAFDRFLLTRRVQRGHA